MSSMSCTYPTVQVVLDLRFRLFILGLLGVSFLCKTCSATACYISFDCMDTRIAYTPNVRHARGEVVR